MPAEDLGDLDPSISIYNPTEEHAALRSMVRSFVEAEVDPQALEHNREEKFNFDLFRKLGDLGLLGITVPTAYGGSEMDAVAAGSPGQPGGRAMCWRMQRLQGESTACATRRTPRRCLA